MARNKYDIDEELQSPFKFKHLVRLLGYIKPYKDKVALTVLIMLLSSAAGLVGPYLIMDAIDHKIPDKDTGGLLLLSGFFLLSVIVTGICLRLKITLMSDIGQSIIRNIRTDIFVKLQKLPFSYYDSRPHGKILVRVVNYVNSLSDLLSNGFINLITDLFSLILIVIFMFSIDVRMTLVSMCGLPVLFAAILGIKQVQRKRWQKVSWKQSNMNAYIHESICGVKVTQSFAREDENREIFRKLSEELKHSWISAIKVIKLVWPIVENLSVWVVAVVYIAGLSWIDQGVSIGVLTAFIGYIWRFWAPITNISNFYNSILVSMAYMERIFETMDEKVLVDNRPGAFDMPKVKGNVEFKDVCFSYDEGGEILHGVNFAVNAGDTIALVGPTGAGKTTVVNLISRFYNVNSGKVLIDGIDVQDVKLDSLRKQMGVMLQDTFIFSGTIMDNIRYGRLDATDEEVMEAAKAVKAHEFIMEMKDGYATEVNERGTRLSVGQRQLIAFARALLADPRILILDEATSSIDTRTEMALQEGLNRLLKGRTSFIIAHRLSTIKNATRIMYIAQGNILEQGTHEELMRLKGAYWKLYTAQYNFLKAI